ncbi:hypothetical protein PA598K_01825 [Paenibacillus sp. 598K]|uniref:response regulator n=1 Tax=Paenibacillus sp. 598K TaxID=1117987 RepID=UPI000FF9FF29|nr:response regulator [Paenibacillus sp. 598K]GBF73530.1 hypothetical protein PA598K_01825 [Paenibacillus sp. 598K]
MRMHAVIIDDDRPAIEELEDALVEAGLIGRVEGYTRVAEAMKHIMRERPDLVLLDIQMPGVQQFRRLFHETAGKLAVRLESEGSTRQALEIIQKQHRHDPLNEALALEAARLYLALRQHRLADDYIERFLLHYDKELGGDGERVLEQYRRMLG